MRSRVAWGLSGATLAAWVCAAASVTAAPLGYLQVKVRAGVVVGLDGRASQTAEGVDGVTFRDLAAGRYWVTLRREGYEIQRATVDVHVGSVAVHRPNPWQPLPARPARSAEPKAKGVGAIIVQTFPVDATVDAKRLGWHKIEKGDQPFIAANVPAGKHKITFCNTYKCLDYRATIVANRLLSIIVDFDPGDIEDVSDLHRRQLAEWRRSCAEGQEAACRRACDLDVALAPKNRSIACEALAKDDQMLARESAPSGTSQGAQDPAVVPVSRSIETP